MTDENSNEAAELARKATRQGKSAAKNAGRAVVVAAEPVVDAVVEEVQDTAQKLEGTTEDAMNVAKRINPWVLSRISGETGQAFLALSVALWSGTVAVNKFRTAYAGRKALVAARRIADSTPQGFPSE